MTTKEIEAIEKYNGVHVFQDIEQMLLENIADFLDSEYIVQAQLLADIKDPLGPSETELHMRMAKAAMEEFKRTVISTR